MQAEAERLKKEREGSNIEELSRLQLAEEELIQVSNNPWKPESLNTFFTNYNTISKIIGKKESLAIYKALS